MELLHLSDGKTLVVKQVLKHGPPEGFEYNLDYLTRSGYEVIKMPNGIEVIGEMVIDAKFKELDNRRYSRTLRLNDGRTKTLPLRPYEGPSDMSW